MKHRTGHFKYLFKNPIKYIRSFFVKVGMNCTFGDLLYGKG